MNKKIDIDLIKENPKNPRKVNDEMLKKLINSIKEDPEIINAKPLVVCDGFVDSKRIDGKVSYEYVKSDDGELYVLGGNMRLRALRSIGYDEVPIFDASEWSLDTKRRFIVKDNLSNGDWDYDLLADSYDKEELTDWGYDDLFKDEDEDVKGDINFTTEILEENNYVVFTFDNVMDWQAVEDIFGLEQKHSLDSKEGYERAGIGRVVDGQKLLDKLNKDENSNSEF